MTKPFLITTGGLDYAWSPSRSTPSARVEIAQLPQIVALLQHGGARSVVDFGAGRGRNAHTLSHAFERLLLVETDENVPRLKALVATMGASHVTVQSWEQYRRKTSPKVDAVVICFVIHTLPTRQMRSAIIRRNVARLRRNGRIVFVTPRNDPKYTPELLADAVRFGDGIVRLYRGRMRFSFYRNYTREQFVQVIDNAALRVDATVPSARRMIFVTRCSR